MARYYKRACADRGFDESSFGKRHLNIGLLSVSLLALSAVAVPAQAQTRAQVSTMSFNIPAQSAGDALEAYARQTGMQLLFPYAGLSNIRTRSIVGEYDRERALAILLKGTGLKVVRRSKNSITLGANSRGSSAPVAGVTRANPKLVSTAVAAPQSGGGVGRKAATQVNDAGSPLIASTALVGDDQTESSVIVVTGSLIRGTGASVGTQVTTVTRDDIEKGGFGTVQEAIQSLPSVFQGGVNEGGRSPNNNNNLSGGTSINLRGLGVGSTLTLINGRRLAAGGSRGGFVDISSIPATLIERIEVLADGASATYGSDAVGGVVNIILRDDFEGAETSLRVGSVTSGGSQEYRASQTFGKSWNNGHALVSYEYYKREALGYSERSFTESSDLRPLGGDDFRRPFSVPGNILDPVTRQPVFAVPDGQDGTNLTPGDLIPGQVNLFNSNAGFNSVFDQKRHSAFFTASQKIGDRLELLAEARYSGRSFFRGSNLATNVLTLDVPSSNPFFVDPFGGSSSILINYQGLPDFGDAAPGRGAVRSLNGVLGARLDLWGDWKLQAHVLYNHERLIFRSASIDSTALSLALADPNPATAFNPFGDGSFSQNPTTIQSVLSGTRNKIDNSLYSGSIVADGSLFQLPAGDVRIAVGGSYDESFLHSIAEIGGVQLANRSFDRNVQSLFGEVYLPIFDQPNRIGGFERLIFTASVRRENYSDAGTTTNPKIGALWTPISGLDIRGTYGTSFRAPDLREFDISGNSAFNFPLANAASPTGSTTSLVLLGNNADLTNETATTWTAGISYSPPILPGFNVDLTYYNVKYSDRITSAENSFASIFAEQERFAPAITLNPNQGQIDAACAIAGSTFINFFGDCGPTPVGAIVDLRLINAAVTNTDGLDFDVNYKTEIEKLGQFNFNIGGTYILTFEEAFGPTSPVVNILNTAGNPIDLRIRSSATWSNKKGLSASAFLNYTGSYTDNVSNPERKIDSWATIDLALSFESGDRLGKIGLDNTKFSFSVRNLFDTDPPFFNNSVGIGYDPENATSLGRFVSFQVTKKW